ncbi:MAG: dockerin type I repeat-containing protein, partial [Planctomycetota bacterium]
VTEGTTYNYQARGVVGVSKSAKTLAICDVTPPLPTLEFLRGNANNDSTVNIADGVFVLAYLFQAGAQPPCMASGDANGDGAVNIADAVYLLTYLFQAGPEPVAPFPECGESTLDQDLNLGCEASGC